MVQYTVTIIMGWGFFILFYFLLLFAFIHNNWECPSDRMQWFWYPIDLSVTDTSLYSDYETKNDCFFLGHDSPLLRLYWAGDKEWDGFYYEPCPWRRIDRSSCWLAVQRATTVPQMPPLLMRQVWFSCNHNLSLQCQISITLI